MAERPRLTLITPVLGEDAEGYAERLAAACAAGDVAAVVLRLGAADERTLVNRVKVLTPGAQEAGAAVVVACDDPSLDLAQVSARGGADGVHVDTIGEAGLKRLRAARERARDGRIVGAGRLRSRDDAMAAGEAGADYLMFGDPRPDGSLPAAEATAERAAWWAEIFETPCVAAGADADAGTLAATGAEFVGIVLGDDPAAQVTAAEAAMRAATAGTA